MAFEPDYLDMDPDSILEENAVITANATCGVLRREYYCHLVEHADDVLRYRSSNTPTIRTKRQGTSYNQGAKSYRDSTGRWIQCNYCDNNDPRLKHPIEYVKQGDPDLWWQSPPLSEGLQYQSVTITMDFKQVYQIVYVLLRMGDSPRPANWILERSVDGIKYIPWVFFAETEYDCKRLYEPLVNGSLTVTNAPRPWKLTDDEVYCTTFYSQPQSLQSGEIIVTLSLDRESTIVGPSGIEQPISPTLIEFLSARYARLRFQKLQTLSGQFMAMPNQLDSSVYNRYYYSIRTIKVGGKCICNSHASQCNQQVVNGVPRAVCVCQHNTCGNNCETCCPLFNQQIWRPGRICEECNCNGKADKCEFNQTVANLRLSMRKDGVHEGGGVCIDCREDTSGINCEQCKSGFYRPVNVRPESPFPCVACSCSSHGSTGECVSNDAEIPNRYPGDCVCKPGFAGKKCDDCAEGYKRSPFDPTQCVPCPCNIQGSQTGGNYRCEAPCNCKVNVNPNSMCRDCQPGHFNLDINNPEGCQACYCSGLTDQCSSVGSATASLLEHQGLLGTISNLTDWKIIVPSEPVGSAYQFASRSPSTNLAVPLAIMVETRTVEAWLSSTSPNSVEQGYYWSAPPPYLGNQITAYQGMLTIILRFRSPIMTSLFGSNAPDYYRRGGSASLAIKSHLDQMWLNEPDVVLEGNDYRLMYKLPSIQRDSHLILKLYLHESNFRVLVEPPTYIPVDKVPISLSQGATQGGPNDKPGRPATVGDLISVLSRLDRLMIKAKYIRDQTTSELRSVKLERATHTKNGGIRHLEECICPVGHTGTSCQSCIPGYWWNSSLAHQGSSTSSSTGNLITGPRSWPTSKSISPTCVSCECHGHSNECEERTGICTRCKHNTAGDSCEVCAPGFYGDAASGSPTACKPCTCPLLHNQQTSACLAYSFGLVADPKPYICVDCANNTRGRYCDVCAEGYYGDPTLGIECKPCVCGRGAVGCNATTGACICGFNTAGPMCDTCANGTHGDPLIGQPCRPCNCHPNGSFSLSCRPGDGQCECKFGYEGVRCERCEVGRGNVDAGCPICQCSPIGSRPEAHPKCNQVTGQCACKPGVGGTLNCSQCAPGYYSLGINGCIECACSKRAVDRTCDPVTGVCNCGMNVIGDTCDKCIPGFFWNTTGSDCLSCDCGIGTLPSSGLIDDCNMDTGQCRCALHVTGRQCTECEVGFFGVSAAGCKPCPRCPNGQVCDQKTGKCICPPNTKGDKCENCTDGSYDYNAVLGCKLCNCSTIGTMAGSTDTCDLQTGQCKCVSGFTGRACDQCEEGHFGYPVCQPCQCDVAGTKRARISNNTSVTVPVVVCNQTDGTCLCKPNVQGDQCDQCKPGTFGLNVEYDLGCYACFCFPTQNMPSCSSLTGYRSVERKEKGVEIIATDNPNSPGGALINLTVGLGPEAVKDLKVGSSQFDWRFSVNRPTFMTVPDLTGRLTRHYGTIMISVHTECLPTGDCYLSDPNKPSTPAIIATNGANSNGVQATNTDTAGSLVIRQPYRIDAKMTAFGGQLELEYQPVEEPSVNLPGGYRYIWLRESDWVLTRVETHDTRVRPSRNELMLALTNVTTFNVRLFMPEAKPKLVAVKYRIYEALDQVTTSSGTEIVSIEKCDCPPTASGDHCMDASSGFYLPPVKILAGSNLKPTDPNKPPSAFPQYIAWTGGVDKCNCNGMSSHCDSITGVCDSCTGNTIGSDCGKCAEGYMGDPKQGQICIKCQCPTEQTDYAITCATIPNQPYGPHQCICKSGYGGPRCQYCQPGYFGDPISMIACQPCDCDMGGSRSTQCDRATGQCECWPNISGRRCDQCLPDHVVEGGKCQDCRGDCTGELLIKADKVKSEIDNLNITGLAYKGLVRLGNQAELMRQRFSPDQAKKEKDLLDLVQEAAKQSDLLENEVDIAIRTRRVVDIQQCESQGKVTDMTDVMKNEMDDTKAWMTTILSRPTSPLDTSTVLHWESEAENLLSTLSGYNLNDTERSMDQLVTDVTELLDAAESIAFTVKPKMKTGQLDMLEYYQNAQNFLSNYYLNQLYKISNDSQSSADELEAAQVKLNNLEKAVKEATNLSVILEFDQRLDDVKAMIKNVTQPLPCESSDCFTEAKDVLKQLSDLPTFTNSPNVVQLESQHVIPLERDAKGILDSLQSSPTLNKTLKARESYQTIVKNLEDADQAITDAELATKASSAAQQDSWDKMIKEVKLKRANQEMEFKVQEDMINSWNSSLLTAIEKLRNTEDDLDRMGNTAQNSMQNAADAQDIAQEARKITADNAPQALNNSENTHDQKTKFNDLGSRLKDAESRYAQLLGTAQAKVDQANATQLNFAKLLGEAESTVKQLDSKLATLRRLSDEARSLLDVTYGALQQDPVPLQLGSGCVYSLIPYSLTKSRVFDIEFWFHLHKLPDATSVLMVGRRAFTGRTQMFAFTFEKQSRKLRFSWNVQNGILESIDQIRPQTWYQVRVTSIAGVTRMMLLERARETGIPTNAQVKKVLTTNGIKHPEAWLMLDRQMEIRLGGVNVPEAGLTNPDAWGDNGAEELWTRLRALQSERVCLFDLRLGGTPMSLVDLASASKTCSKPDTIKCQVLKHRDIVRDGYIWQKQNDISNITNVSRPTESSSEDFVLQRLFFYDFSGTGGYARLNQLPGLMFCQDRLHLQPVPLPEAKLNNMMVLTLYSFTKDVGVTVEWIGGKLQAKQWTGGNLYRTDVGTDPIGNSLLFRRRRILRSNAYYEYYHDLNRRRRFGAGRPEQAVRLVQISNQNPTINLWAIDAPPVPDCDADTALFVGAIPPGHHSLRRRMKQLGITLTPFNGRIGLTNNKLNELRRYLDDYRLKPSWEFGDTRFTDLRQDGEARSVDNVKPKDQHCLRILPHKDYVSAELDISKLPSPWKPGISMTVQFAPGAQILSMVHLLRIQLKMGQWFSIWITRDHRLGIGIPKVNNKLITEEPLGFRPVNDPAFALYQLEWMESQLANASLPLWNEKSASSDPMLTANGDTQSAHKNPFEVSIMLHFGGSESRQLYVLYDQRIVQSWTIPKIDPMEQVAQVFVGPHAAIQHEISISHLVIGNHLVDFATDIKSNVDRPGTEVGICGGQLRPRFIRRTDLTQSVWVEQGLDMASPPSGRTLRFVPLDNLITALKERNVSITLPGVPSQNLQIPQDCAPNPSETAWFDQSEQSYWQLNSMTTRNRMQQRVLDMSIGFRAQLQATVEDEEVYSMLAAFNFGPNDGTLYVILSQTQIFVVTSRADLVWFSPHLTIGDASWHQLNLTIPKNGQTVDPINGLNAESGPRLIFDGRFFWLPKVSMSGPPVLSFIGGLPNNIDIPLDGSKLVSISRLRGCVDKLVLDGMIVSTRRSGRPTCFDCFSLHPNMIHVPQSIGNYLKTNLIRLDVPAMYMQEGIKEMAFEFNFFYNQTKLRTASLFVLTFHGDVDDFRIWLHLEGSQVLMKAVNKNEPIEDLGYSAELFATSAATSTSWHFVRLEIVNIDGMGIFVLHSQQTKSIPLMYTAKKLKAIHVIQDDDLTPDRMGKASRPFVGCFRDIRLSMPNGRFTVLKFPAGIPGILEGVCHTTEIE